MEMLGVEKGDFNIYDIFKERNRHKIAEQKAMIKLFDLLTGLLYEYVPFSKINSISMIFFISQKVREIKDRVKTMRKMCSKKYSGSLFRCFVKHGMDSNHPDQQNISFRMVEKVVNDMKIQNPSALGYKQVYFIMKSIQQRIPVDLITGIEKQKISFESGHRNNREHFGKWLACKIIM
jgi:hypothetical protein